MSWSILKNEGDTWRGITKLDSKKAAMEYVEKHICKPLNMRERANGEVWITDDMNTKTLSNYKVMIYEARP